MELLHFVRNNRYSFLYVAIPTLYTINKVSTAVFLKKLKLWSGIATKKERFRFYRPEKYAETGASTLKLKLPCGD